MNGFSAHNMLALLTIGALCLCAVACGGDVAKTHSSVVVPASNSITGDYDGDDDYRNKLHTDSDNDDSTKPKDRDNDSDNSSNSYYDRDDNSVRGFGRAANAADTKLIASLVRRYFAAANAEDGKAACSMIASNFAKSVPETLGGLAGPPYARGTTCAGVMSGIFEHYHRQLAAHAVRLEVSRVRVDHDEGIAILAFPALPGRQIRVVREGTVWKMDALLDTELP